MIVFMYGMFVGVVAAGIGFVIWNLQSSKVDDLEEDIREYRDEWEKGKAELKDRIRKMRDKAAK